MSATPQPGAGALRGRLRPPPAAIAILFATLIGGALVLASGANPLEAYAQIFYGALAWDNLPNTLNWATPLVGMTLVTPSPEDSPGYFERLNQLCAFAHFTPATLFPVHGFENVLGMVAAGYGVTIMPEVVVGSPGPAWRTRRLCAPVPTMELKLLWLRASSSLVLQNFLSVVRGCTDYLPASSLPA